MAQYQVPQFIDIESKIVGPLTIRQFLYLAGAGGISFVLFFLLQTWLWFIITVFMVVIGASLAFIKYNSQPLPKIIWLGILYYWHPKTYLWRSEPVERTIELPEIKEERKNLKELLPKMPSVKKLWQDILTTKTVIPKREKPWAKVSAQQFQVFRKLTGQKEAARRVDYR